MATRTSRFIAIALVVLAALFLLKYGYANGAREGFSGGTDKFVMYYADWCPHCKTVKPAFSEWSKKGSIQINGKTVFLEMVEEQEKEKAAGKPVKGYPTFLLETADGKFKEFDGERSPSGWESWLKSNL
jgi:thiol-disulfide isomerase/thioredoxin